MHIAFFIGSLNTGGAERQMTVLAKGLAARGHRVSIVTVFPGGYYADTLAGVPNLTLSSLNPNRGHSLTTRIAQLVLAPKRLRCLLKRERPDRLYSMLEYTNLFAWMATTGRYRRRLIWGYRSSNVRFGWKMRMADRLCAWVSPTVPLMITNSSAGMRYALQCGYRPNRGVTIPNGIDTDLFQPQLELAARFRTEIGVSPTTPLVGMVARLDPLKGHNIFLYAAARIAKIAPNCQFVCVGDGRAEYKRQLHQKTDDLGLSEKVFWLGNRTDMSAIYSALNVAVSSSYGEGFPNAVGEAMACGTPCVVTEVGESARLVGNTGAIIPVGDVEALVRQISKILEGSTNTGLEIRKRIESEFSVNQFIQRTLSAIT